MLNCIFMQFRSEPFFFSLWTIMKPRGRSCVRTKISKCKLIIK